ncbi:ABC transporter ATP-binding protein [Cellulomonas denverensis]|uniref:ABC transporter ATP-binding protein n=1 Tax=Cellulomonas denverensis TaxID=264297 RepID=A0A7X6KTT3_9CELL|nr:ABC transporter ATP-binding protein [Cellulomonas denverensis]NKY21960.1 ABC transporter ATP-binding protein [Cellulomonas denverensis]GIG24147.1 tetronasin ABC transporter ATP-binding protein [Cellulomonas denverensis]
MSTAVIDVRELTKTFGPTRALDRLDLRVEPGQVHGFLGPNGAGKSTTIRALLGMLRPDGGRLRLLGGDPWRDAVRLHRRLGYVPGDVALWPNLTGTEAIDTVVALRGHHDPRLRAELTERFALDPTRRCSAYSTGNRRKVALVAALCSRVDLLVLDEPTAGLDPLMEEVFQQCVREAAARGTTVLLSSHILSEVEALCDHLTIVREGRAVRSGRLDRMRDLAATVVLVRPRTPLPGALLDRWDAADAGAGTLRLEVPAADLDEALRVLAAAGVSHLECRPPSLEELFLAHYAGDRA